MECNAGGELKRLTLGTTKQWKVPLQVKVTIGIIGATLITISVIGMILQGHV